MSHRKIWALKKEIKAAAVVLMVLIFCLPSAAMEEREGAEVLIHKKDGQRIKAELLAVKEDRLILMDVSNFSDVTCPVGDIKSLCLVKRTKILKGLELGSLSGGIAGAGLGLLSGSDKKGLIRFTAGQKALVLGVGLAAAGLIIGGISGGFAGIDESVDIEGRSSEDIGRILRRLDREARSPQRLPQDWLKLTAVSKKERGGDLSSEEPAKPKFKRLHLTYRPGFARSQAARRSARLFREIGFGDTKPARELYFFGFYLGTSPAVDYPRTAAGREVIYGDFRADYSVTGKLAVGVGFSSLGESRVNGYRYIPVNRGGADYYSELYLNADFSGRLYYFMVSYMPLPDPFLRKASFELGAGAGWGRLNLCYSTSKNGSYGVPDNQRAFSKAAIALLGFAEFDYFFNRVLSLGLNVEFRYAPVRVGSFRLEGYYFDLDESFQLIESAMSVTMPEHRINAGGFRFGASVGFHL